MMTFITPLTQVMLLQRHVSVSQLYLNIELIPTQQLVIWSLLM